MPIADDRGGRRDQTSALRFHQIREVDHLPPTAHTHDPLERSRPLARTADRRGSCSERTTSTRTTGETNIIGPWFHGRRLAATRVLAIQGPTLGRPLVDTIEGSRHANMKEPPIEGQGTTMSMKDWEKKVLAEPGAADRVAEIEDELRLAAGLTSCASR